MFCVDRSKMPRARTWPSSKSQCCCNCCFFDEGPWALALVRLPCCHEMQHYEPSRQSIVNSWFGRSDESDHGIVPDAHPTGPLSPRENMSRSMRAEAFSSTLETEHNLANTETSGKNKEPAFEQRPEDTRGPSIARALHDSIPLVGFHVPLQSGMNTPTSQSGYTLSPSYRYQTISHASSVAHTPVYVPWARPNPFEIRRSLSRLIRPSSWNIPESGQSSSSATSRAGSGHRGPRILHSRNGRLARDRAETTRAAAEFPPTEAASSGPLQSRKRSRSEEVENDDQSTTIERGPNATKRPRTEPEEPGLTTCTTSDSGSDSVEDRLG